MANVNGINVSSFVLRDNNRRIIASRFVATIRDHANDNGSNVQEIVGAILGQHENLDTLCFDLPLEEEDELGAKILSEVISSSKIKTLMILCKVEARCVPSLLRLAIPKFAEKKFIHLKLGHFPMSVDEAEEIFHALRTITIPLHLVMRWHAYDTALTSFARYLRNPGRRLRKLSIGWRCSVMEDQSLELFSALCDAISDSPRLGSLVMCDVPLPDTLIEKATECLANAVACSTSVEYLLLDESGRVSMDNVQRSLLQSNKIKNNDLFFKRTFRPGRRRKGAFKLVRTSPFKSLLSQNVPLNYWPRILTRADTWNEVDSHSSHDFLFFLIREKNDVLLQNGVHSRHIRKRKFSEFSS
jgi:hypothetical protein